MRWLIFFGLVLAGCGYHFENGGPRRFLSVPYVEGDDQGLLTSALIRTLARKGNYYLNDCQTDLVLKVCLFEPEELNVGFIFVRNEESSELKEVIGANEARLSLRASVTLMDGGGCIVAGPFDVRASLSYDFDPDLGSVNEHFFSLGQLEMHNGAQRAAYPSLYQLLAEKIVDYVN